MRGPSRVPKTCGSSQLCAFIRRNSTRRECRVAAVQSLRQEGALLSWGLSRKRTRIQKLWMSSSKGSLRKVSCASHSLSSRWALSKRTTRHNSKGKQRQLRKISKIKRWKSPSCLRNLRSSKKRKSSKRASLETLNRNRLIPTTAIWRSTAMRFSSNSKISIRRRPI